MELDVRTEGLAGSELSVVTGSRESFLIGFISECLESFRERESEIRDSCTGREKRFFNVRCLLL